MFIASFSSAAAFIVPNTAMPPDLSSFIWSIFIDGLMLIPPESKVIALPTSPTVGKAAATLPAGLYFKTINRGLFCEPAPTARIPPIPFSAICFSSKTVQLNAFELRANSFAISASLSGFITLPGRFANVLVQLWALPIAIPPESPLFNFFVTAESESISSTLSRSSRPSSVPVTNSSYR